jgi:hypothetical protein
MIDGVARVRGRPMQALTTREATRLAELKEQISSGLATFVQIGLALVEVRDRRLYRQTHDTFEAYCEGRWHFKRSHAYRLIDAAAVVNNLPPQEQGPANELQARELERVPAAEQP